MTMLIGWFETNDIYQRLSVLFLLACLFGFTTNITNAFAGTYPQLIAFYLAARLYMATYLIMVAWLLPMVRAFMISLLVVTFVVVGLWIGSIFVPYPQQLVLIWLGLILENIAHTFSWFVVSVAKRFDTRVSRWTLQQFEFMPALNIEHKTERTNAFVTLVLGYSVVAILYQNKASFGMNAFFGKAIMGLIQAFCFNWIYFEIDGSNLKMHAIRRHKWSAVAWMNAHLPFIMSFILAGGALSRLVVLADCPGTNVNNLTDSYQVRSGIEIKTGIRWFYCAGLGVSLASMGCIALTHIHKEMPTHMPKRKRMIMRFAGAISLICLPMAESLNSLQLIGAVTGIIVVVLMSELWAQSCSRDTRLFDRSGCCRYTGHVGKKDLQEIVSGGTVKIENIKSARHCAGASAV